MNIVCTFNSYEEMEEFAAKIHAQAEKSRRVREEVILPDPEKEEAKPKPKKEAPKKAEPRTPAPKEEPKAEAPEEELPLRKDEQTKKYTKIEVRAKLKEMGDRGLKAERTAIISSFGVEKFSEVKPEDYPALMQKVGEALA